MQRDCEFTGEAENNGTSWQRGGPVFAQSCQRDLIWLLAAGTQKAGRHALQGFGGITVGD
jgi:hypothetical protein